MEKYPVPDYSLIVQAILRRNTPTEGPAQGSMEASAIPGGAGGGRFSEENCSTVRGKPVV